MLTEKKKLLLNSELVEFKGYKSYEATRTWASLLTFLWSTWLTTEAGSCMFNAEQPLS